MIERMTDLHPASHANYGVALVSILITAHILLNLEYRSILIDILREKRVWIVGLFILLAMSVIDANAGSAPARWTYQTGGRSGESGDVVCAPNSFSSATDYEYNGLVYTGWCMSGTQKLSQVSKYMSCSGIGGTETGSRTGGMTCVCPGSQVPENGVCKEPSPCASKAGMDVDDGTVDFGDGANKRLSMVFTAKSSDDYVGNTFCTGGCQASITKEVGGGGVTINGKYAGTFNAKFSGSACNTGQQNVNKTTDPGLLPKDSDEKKCVDKGMGFGYVNEKVMCVPADKTNSTEKKTGETTKPDGSRTTESKTDKTICSGGVCTTTTTTITTEYNSSGTATGTTTKTETTSKPDPNAAVSGNGSGGGGEGAECGIPGKPPCSVKVDETGTPSDISGINSNKTALETAMDQIKDKFNEVSQPKQWSVVWNYQLPSGACAPLQFGGQRFSTSLDICKPLGYVRDLWSYVISFLTGLYIWRSCRDALNLT